MKLFAFFVLLFPVVLFAELTTPGLFIRHVIEEVQAESKTLEEIIDFELISTHPRHAYTKESLINFLKTIDLKKVKFTVVNDGIVRMKGQLNYDFGYELRKNPKPGKPNKIYTLTTVHP